MKRIIVLLLAAVLLLSPCVCAMAKTRVFVDDAGRNVSVPAEISRFAVSGAMPQIVLYALAPDMFVGLADRWYESAKAYIPKEHLDWPYLGKLYGSADMNVEQLALCDPQVIIDMGEMKKGLEEDLDSLQMQTSIPSVFIRFTLKDAPKAYRRLGGLLGREEKAEELAQLCERVYARAVSIMEKVGDDRKKVLFITGDKGHNVLAKGSYQAELIDMLTENLAVVDNPVSKGTGNEVSMEQIMLWDPEFIIFAPESVYDKVNEDGMWGLMTAVANGNYIRTPQGPHNWLGSPLSVQQTLGLIWLPAVLYPEYCDYDVKEEIREYYRLFYHCELTDEQYDELMAGAFLSK